MAKIHEKKTVPVYLLIVLTLSLSFSLSPCTGADLLEVLCSGHTGSMPLMAQLLGREPMTEVTVIPTRIHGVTEVTPEKVRRYMRLYFPRTYEALIEGYEFLLLRGIDCTYFTARQLEWMRRAIEEDGIGGLQDRSVMSSNTAYAEPWSESSTSRAFPNDAEAVVSVDYTKHGSMEVIMNQDQEIPPIFTPYGELLEYQIGSGGYTMMIPKEGATTYMSARIPSYSEFAYPEPGVFPHTLGWRYGEGYTWSLMDYSGSGFWGQAKNPYGMDAYLGMLMYSTGRKLPGDVVTVHRLRINYHQYAEQKGFIYSMISFVERFGANTQELEEEIGEMDREWKQSRDLYLGQEYGGATEILDRILAEIEKLRGEALKTKDRALLWIYVIEWLAVTGTALVSAFAIWTLMVRRRLYREVEATRLTQR
jgi:hypothetical protein